MAVWKIWKVEGITFFLRIPKGSVSGRMMLFFLFTMKMWLWVKAHVIPWWKQTNVACFFNAFRINHHIWYNSCWYNRFGLIPIYIYMIIYVYQHEIIKWGWVVPCMRPLVACGIRGTRVNLRVSYGASPYGRARCTFVVSQLFARAGASHTVHDNSSIPDHVW